MAPLSACPHLFLLVPHTSYGWLLRYLDTYERKREEQARVRRSQRRALEVLEAHDDDDPLSSSGRFSTRARAGDDGGEVTARGVPAATDMDALVSNPHSPGTPGVQGVGDGGRRRPRSNRVLERLSRSLSHDARLGGSSSGVERGTPPAAPLWSSAPGVAPLSSGTESPEGPVRTVDELQELEAALALDMSKVEGIWTILCLDRCPPVLSLVVAPIARGLA